MVSQVSCLWYTEYSNESEILKIMRWKLQNKAAIVLVLLQRESNQSINPSALDPTSNFLPTWPFELIELAPFEWIEPSSNYYNVEWIQIGLRNFLLLWRNSHRQPGALQYYYVVINSALILLGIILIPVGQVRFVPSQTSAGSQRLWQRLWELTRQVVSEVLV